MGVDLGKLQALLDDVEWNDAERSLVNQAVAELRQARKPVQQTVESLFGLAPPPKENPDDIGLRFTIATPPSSKNEQKMRVIHGRRGKPIPIRYRTQEVLDHVEAIQNAAVLALQRQAPRCFAENLPLLDDDDARVEMIHNVMNETVDVLVRRAGARQKGNTGKRRDVHNLPELICDAIQKIAFRNDNQVVDLRVWRNLGLPTTTMEN